MVIEKGKIGVREFTVLVFMYTLGTSVITIPSLVATFAQENAWITVIITAMIGLLIVLILNNVNKIAPHKNLFELNEFVFGKWLGKAVSMLFFLFIFFMTAGNLRQIGDFITTQVMVDTPIQIIMLIFILTSLVGVKLGLEVIGRTSEIFFPYAFVSLVLLIALVAPQTDLTKIQPMLQNIEATLLTVVPTLGAPYFEIFVFLAILPYVNKIKSAKKGFYKGVGLASTILIAITFMCLAVLGPEFTSRNVYPTYILGKKISIASFIERIEVLVAIAWFFTIFFKITINFYVLSLGISHLLKLKNPKTLSTPLAFLLIIFGMIISPSIIHYLNDITFYWTPLAATFGLGLPLVILLVGRVRYKNRSE